MLRWLRRQVNGDLRYWRGVRATAGRDPAGRVEAVVADCMAKRDMLTWAEHWAESDWSYSSPEVRGQMLSHQGLVMAAMRRLAAGYRGRDGWRPEWELNGD